MYKFFNLVTVIMVFPFATYAQGTFQNLDFEAANIPPGVQSGDTLDTVDALPGWLELDISNPYEPVGFNIIFRGLPTLLDTNGVNGSSSIEGVYSVYLASLLIPQDVAPSGSAIDIPSSISQIGLVPVTARTLLFKAQPGAETLRVLLGGQNIPFSALDAGPNYTLYGGDISAFAGQTVPLEFLVQSEPLNLSGWNLDSISFSPQAVPEPSSTGLLASSVGMLLAFRCRKITRRNQNND